MDNKFLVEESLSITPKDIIRDLDWKNSDNLAIKGRSDISFWLEAPGDVNSVVLSVGGAEPQKINFEWIGITYGERTYFQCACGLRSSKLYLPRNGTEFKCRKCHHLQYFLTTFNKNSVAGREFYKMSRIQKLAESRASMGRILYNGKFSERFERFIRLCDRSGFNDIVKGFNQLKTLIGK